MEILKINFTGKMDSDTNYHILYVNTGNYVWM